MENNIIKKTILSYFYPILYFIFIQAFLFIILISCTNDEGDDIIDTTPPDAVISPEDGAELVITSEITITFNEPMDTESIVISGDLESYANASWNEDNTVLTIFPDSEWTSGIDQTLIINVADTSGNQSSFSYTFSIGYPAPAISSITPASGENTGSINISSLAGSGFRDGSSVKLSRESEADIEASSVVVVSSNQITCSFDLTDAAGGKWDVVVTNEDDKSDILESGFEITYPAPLITSITPAIGTNTGTINITNLAGTNFRDGAIVFLTKEGETDIQASSITVVSSEQITCSIDLSDVNAGEWDVKIINSDNKTAELEKGFAINIMYVSVSGDDTNGDGTKLNPWATITYARTTMQSGDIIPGIIRVSAGTYSSAETVYVVCDIALEGGYSVDWTARGYETEEDRENLDYMTTVEYSGTGDVPVITASYTNPTENTYVEGFSIQGGYSTYAVQIMCPELLFNNNTIISSINGIYVLNSESVSISNNIINNFEDGIYIKFSDSTTINNNTIITANKGINLESSDSTSINNNTILDGAVGAICLTSSNSADIINNTIECGSNGVYLKDADSVNIINNVIDCSGYGAYIESPAPTFTTAIINNTIICGHHGIYTIASSNYINNNIIISDGPSYGIYEEYLISDPIEIKNNNIYGFISGFYYDLDTHTAKTTIEDMEAMDPTNYSGNISEGSDIFVDYNNGDYHLSPSAPVNVRGGGLDLSSDFTTDQEGTIRTTSTPTGMTNANSSGWSMGAYETD